MHLIAALMFWSLGKTLVVGTDAPTLEATLAMAVDGDTVVLPKAVWSGHFRVTRSITLRGESAVLDGGGTGTVLILDAPGIVLENLHVRNGGSDLAAPDHGILVTKKARGAVLRGNRVSGCAFGIWLHETHDAQLLDNTVEGTTEGHTSNRGNGIQLFDCKGLTVRGNLVRGGRDGIYVSATEESLIEANTTEFNRYGVHYMFSYNNTLRNNVATDSKIGLALMQSRNLVVVGNRAENNSRNGILFRDAQFCRIENNILRNNGEGLFFYSSTENQIIANHIEGNEVGVKVWAGSLRNTVSRNRFINNRKQVFFVGTEDLLWGTDQVGNYWSDYLGWDQDGDGCGDRPYRVNSFSSHLVYRYPATALLLRSPSLELLTHMESRLPVFRVPTLIDMSPMLEDRAHEDHQAAQHIR